MTQLAMPIATPARMTVDDMLSMPDSRGFELVDGVLVDRDGQAGSDPMGAEASRIAAKIVYRLLSFVEPRQLGVVFDAEATYECFGTHHTGRRADVSFIRRERLPDGAPRGALTIPADLAVEVVSPNDKLYDVNAKVRLYLRNGFGVVWVVLPDDAAVDVHAAGRKLWRASGDDPVDAEPVLPGFSCPASAFFQA